MIRLVATTCLIAAAVAAWSGCKAPSNADRRVAFLLSTLQEERYQKDKMYFEARAKELGLDVMSLAADNDNARQVAQVEDALTRGAKVIVVQPTDSAAASAYLRMAHQQGAKVVAYDRAIYSKDLDFYVSHDSYQVGVLQAKAAIEATGGKGIYVILAGQAGHSVASEITRGYKDTLRPYLDRGDISVVSEQHHSAWSPEQALKTVEDAISRSDGKIDAILANNSGMARGAVQAVSAAGLREVFIAGADADAANVNFVCQGKQTVEVLKDIAPLANTAAEVAAMLVQGGEVPGAQTMELGGGQVPMAAVRVALVTPETVKELVVGTGFLGAGDLPGCADRLAQAPLGGDAEMEQ
jgi:D-xylose transport system substrate-binding protein